MAAVRHAAMQHQPVIQVAIPVAVGCQFHWTSIFNYRSYSLVDAVAAAVVVVAAVAVADT